MTAVRERLRTVLDFRRPGRIPCTFDLGAQGCFSPLLLQAFNNETQTKDYADNWDVDSRQKQTLYHLISIDRGEYHSELPPEGEMNE